MAQIITSGSAEGIARKFIPPVPEGLEAWHFLNESLAKAARNYAVGKPDAVVVGAPAADANSIRFKSLSNFIQTSVSESLEATFILVAKPADTLATNLNRPMYFGTYRSLIPGQTVETFGVSMAATSATQATAFASRGTNADDDTSAGLPFAADAASWQMLSMTVPNQQGTLARNETTNTSLRGGTVTPRLLSSGQFRIGSGYHDFGGSCDMAFWAYYSRVLSDAERQKTVDAVRRYLASRPTPLIV